MEVDEFADILVSEWIDGWVGGVKSLLAGLVEGFKRWANWSVVVVDAEEIRDICWELK